MANFRQSITRCDRSGFCLRPRVKPIERNDRGLRNPWFSAGDAAVGLQGASNAQSSTPTAPHWNQQFRASLNICTTNGSSPMRTTTQFFTPGTFKMMRYTLVLAVM